MAVSRAVRGQVRLPVDGERARILGWICLLIAVNQLRFGAIVPVVPLYAESYGVSAFAVGSTIAVYGLARFLVNVPAGRLADARGRRATLALGGLVTVLGNVGCALAPTYELFLGARFVAGAGAAMVLTGGQIVVADIASPHNRGRLLGVYQGVFLFAVGAGPIPGGLLADRVGLAAPFAVNAAAAGVVALLAWYRVPETRDLRDATRTTGGAGTPAPAAAWMNAGFLLISAVSFTAFFARTGGLFSVVPLIAEDEIGLGPDEIGLGLGMISLVGLFLSYPSGWLVDRFGRKAVIVPSTLISGASMVLFSFIGDLPGYLGACAVWSASSGIASAAPAAYAADIATPGRTAVVLGRYRTIADAGYVVGPLTLGFIASAVSADAALWFCAVLIVAVGSAFAVWAPETHVVRRR